VRRKTQVELGESGIAQELRWIQTGLSGQLRSRGKDLCLVAGFVVAGRDRAGARLRNHGRAGIYKAHHRRFVEDVLIVSRKKEGAIAFERPSKGEAKLPLVRNGALYRGKRYGR
jgi:hypothetical protein